MDFIPPFNMLKNGIGYIRKGINRAKANGKRRQLNRTRNMNMSGGGALVRSVASSSGLRAGENRTYSNLPHHNMMYTYCTKVTLGSGGQGDYKLSLKIRPYAALMSSAYKYLADIYEKGRVNSYTVTIYFPTANPIARSSAAAWLARDSSAVTGISEYIQIIQQPGHKRGRERTRFTFRWNPVEPLDSNYDELDEKFDSKDWGTLLYGINSDTNFTSLNPLLEFRVNMSFANLKLPPLPADQLGKFESDDWEPIRPVTPRSRNQNF